MGSEEEDESEGRGAAYPSSSFRRWLRRLASRIRTAWAGGAGGLLGTGGPSPPALRRPTAAAGGLGLGAGDLGAASPPPLTRLGARPPGSGPRSPQLPPPPWRWLLRRVLLLAAVSLLVGYAYETARGLFLYNSLVWDDYNEDPIPACCGRCVDPPRPGRSAFVTSIRTPK